MKFVQLLIDTLNNSNEVREQAERTLNQLKEANYQHFLFKLLKNILKTDNPASFYISFSIILQDIRSRKLFSNEEIFNLFMPNFQNILSQIFATDKLNSSTCNILSLILSSISLNFPETGVNQFLIMSISQFPQLQCFFIITLSTILAQSKNDAPFEVYLSILSLPNNSHEDYNSKMLLLFSIIQHFPQNAEHIYSILSQFISNIPDESIQNFLHLFSINIHQLTDFFEEYITTILSFITNCIETHQNELSIQAEAIECLTNIAISFKHSHDIINNILSIILQMIEAQNMENEPVLKESIHIISRNLQSTFLDALSNIQNEKKIQYSYLLALSEIDEYASFKMLNHTIDYFNQIVSFLNIDNNQVPDINLFRMKRAAFLAIENLCNIIGPTFQQDNFDNLFTFLCKELTTESNFQLVISILRCLSNFLKKVKFNSIDEKVTFLFNFLIQLFMNSKEETVMTEALTTMSYLATSLSSSFIEFYPSLIQMMSQIDLSIQSELSVPVIRLCDVCISSIQKVTSTKSIENLNRDQLMPLFLYSIEMRNRVESESDFFFVSRAIISFINFLGDSAATILLQQVVPMALSSASSEIEVTRLPEGHGVESVPGFLCVSPLDFAKVSTIQSVELSLETLLDSLAVLRDQFCHFSKVALQIASNWISYTFILPRVRSLSWALLNQLVLYFGGTSDIDLNATFSLFLYRPQLEIGSNDSCLVLLNAMSVGIERKCIDLAVIPSLLGAFMSSLHNKYQNFFNDDIENFEDDDQLLRNETKFFKFCVKNFPEIGGQFFRETVGPFIPQMVKIQAFLDFVIKVTTVYIITSHDMTVFADFEKILFDSLSDLESETVMKSIGNFLCQRNFTFPIDFYVISYQKMCEILNDDVSFENDSLCLYNETILSFTKLLCYHSDIFASYKNGIGLKNALRLWFNSIPKVLNNKKNFFVFDFLSYLIREKLNDLLEIVGPAELIKLLLNSIGQKGVSQENAKIFISFIQNFISTKGNPFTTTDENQNSLLNELELLRLQKIMELFENK